MKGAGRFLIVILAVTSIGVTAMLTLKVAARYADPARPDLALRGGAAGPEADQGPQVLFTLPQFTLTERSGKPAGTEQLRGKVWIADFVFTSCAGPCPMMSSQMQGLQEKLAKTPGWSDIRLVSFSVDPDRDTPEVLREYAAQFHADAEHWLFLTGPREKMWPLVTDGFKLHVGSDKETQQLTHSEKFVLVDRASRVRGLYDGLETAERTRLLRDLDRVLKEKK